MRCRSVLLGGNSEEKGKYTGGDRPRRMSSLSHMLDAPVLESNTGKKNPLGWLEGCENEQEGYGEIRLRMREGACEGWRAPKLSREDRSRASPAWFSIAALEHVPVWTEQKLHPTHFTSQKSKGYQHRETAWPTQIHRELERRLPPRGQPLWRSLRRPSRSGPDLWRQSDPRSPPRDKSRRDKGWVPPGPAEWFPAGQRQQTGRTHRKWGTQDTQRGGAAIAGDCAASRPQPGPLPVVDPPQPVPPHQLRASMGRSGPGTASLQSTGAGRGHERSHTQWKESQLRPDPQNFCSFSLGSDPTPKRRGW